MSIKETVKKRKALFLICGVFTAILLIVFFSSGSNHSAPAGVKTKKGQKVEINLLGKGDLEKENWRATAEKEIVVLKNSQKEILEQIRLLNEQQRAKQETSKPGPLPAGPAGAPFQIPDLKQFPPTLSASNTPAPPRPQPPAPPSRPPEPSAGVFAFEPEHKPAPMSAKPGPVQEKTKGKQKDRNEILAGSFVKGTLLSGLDAPTGINSSKEPHPILIQLTDLAVLPNRFRFDVQGCLVVGEGYGELSSERAYVRVINLSCIKNNGKTFDIPISGYVAGEDGKNGMRGRVVSKEGALIAKSLVAGVAEGFAKFFTLSASTVSVSPLGATQTFEPDKALEAGGFNGVAVAAKNVSQYYLRMAERMFPIIEIDAGRQIVVVFLKKVTFDEEEG